MNFDMKKDLPIGELMISKNGKTTKNLFKGLGITQPVQTLANTQDDAGAPLPGEDDLDKDIADIFHVQLIVEPKSPKNQNSSMNHPDVQKLHKKHVKLQESAVSTLQKEVLEQRTRDLGKLKILASDHKRAESVGANKDIEFLGHILNDHNTSMSKKRDEIKTDLDMGNFSALPSCAIKSCLKGFNQESIFGKSSNSTFKSRSRSQIDDYDMRGPS